MQMSFVFFSYGFWDLTCVFAGDVGRLFCKLLISGEFVALKTRVHRWLHQCELQNTKSKSELLHLARVLSDPAGASDANRDNKINSSQHLTRVLCGGHSFFASEVASAASDAGFNVDDGWIIFSSGKP
jgi:hypothetical protein